MLLLLHGSFRFVLLMRRAKQMTRGECHNCRRMIALEDCIALCVCHLCVVDSHGHQLNYWPVVHWNNFIITSHGVGGAANCALSESAADTAERETEIHKKSARRPRHADKTTRHREAVRRQLWLAENGTHEAQEAIFRALFGEQERQAPPFTLICSQFSMLRWKT